ncbi:hypothetical protein B566_EDAN018940, partial [Ephemera danica]
MAVLHTVENFNDFIQLTTSLEAKPEPIYVLFTGSKNQDGKSWCPDCVKGSWRWGCGRDQGVRDHLQSSVKFRARSILLGRDLGREHFALGGVTLNVLATGKGS